MKTNTKGFTLIELLAVIVILAVIALIASPIVLGIINNSRESSMARSVESFATAAQQAFATAMSKPGYMGEDVYIVPVDDKTYACAGDGVTATTCPDSAKIREEVKYSGSTVACGTVNYEQATGYLLLEDCHVSNGEKAFRYYNAAEDIMEDGKVKVKTTHGSAERDPDNDTKKS